MFSATDVAEMVWHSDSDYGEMEGGSNVEIEEHVSSFSVINIASIASLKLGKSSLSMSSLRHRLSWTMTVRCTSIPSLVLFLHLCYILLLILSGCMTYFNNTVTCLNN